MAITIVDNRLILNECDSITGWTSTDGPTTFSTAPTPIESNLCLGLQASNAVESAYVSITSDDYSGGGSLSVWFADRASFDTVANTGYGIIASDGTNRIAYAVGGSDGTGFRYDEGPVKWSNSLIDLANKPANFVAVNGSEASLNEAAITEVGVYFNTVAKSVGGADNCFWDIIRWADNGVGIEFYGGTVGTPEEWTTVATGDRATGNQQAHGILRQTGATAFGIQGNINIGDNTSTNDTYINADGLVFTFEDRGQSANNYYRFNCAGNGTGTTDVNFDGCGLINALDGSIDVSDANVTCDFRDGTISGWTQGINTGGSGNVWSGNKFANCGTLTTTGTDLRNSKFTGFTGVADDSQLFWNSTSDPDGDIDGSSFTMGANDTHAIEFPTGLNSGAITIRDCNFSGYSATDDVNASTFNVLATTGTLTINIIGGSGNVSVKSAGCVVTVVQNPVTLKLTVQNTSGTKIQDARVFVQVANGDNFPYQASVTITRVSTTATVAHTAHGLANGDKVVIRGVNQSEYYGVHTISNVSTNAYDFTVAGSPTTPATGTITSSFVLISGLTDVNGEVTDSRTYSVDQAITGNVRKSSESPYYKSGAVVGSVSSTGGLSSTIVLLSDE